MRLVQHKREAYYFYRFLSNFYDKLVNPLFWTARMRTEALELLSAHSRALTVVDVGSGTGFTTLGIVQLTNPENVTCLDQSPHQMAHAKAKKELQGCTFLLGDAEQLPFANDTFDRYVSAGSIEYWPNPQIGIQEAYRVIKQDGIALLIGPLEPAKGLGRFLANTWMLFPKEEEYREWYRNAGFVDIQVRYIRPHWYRSKSEYGLAISGRKPQAGASPNSSIPLTKESPLGFEGNIRLIFRVFLGSLAGFIFIPAALLAYLRGAPPGLKRSPDEYLNGFQIGAAVVILLAIALLISWIM